MKNIFPLFVLIFISLSSLAQTSVSNFQLENNTIIYRYVFEGNLTEEDFIRQLHLTQGIKGAVKQGDIIVAELDGVIIDYKKHGGKTYSVPMVMRHPLHGNLIAEFKEGRYRITISNMEFKSTETLTESSYPMSFYAVNKRNEWRKGKNHLAILFYTDKHFQDVFAAKEVTASEDW